MRRGVAPAAGGPSRTPPAAALAGGPRAHGRVRRAAAADRHAGSPRTTARCSTACERIGFTDRTPVDVDLAGRAPTSRGDPLGTGVGVYQLGNNVESPPRRLPPRLAGARAHRAARPRARRLRARARSPGRHARLRRDPRGARGPRAAPRRSGARGRRAARGSLVGRDRPARSRASSCTPSSASGTWRRSAAGRRSSSCPIRRSRTPAAMAARPTRAAASSARGPSARGRPDARRGRRRPERGEAARRGASRGRTAWMPTSTSRSSGRRVPTVRRRAGGRRRGARRRVSGGIADVSRCRLPRLARRRRRRRRSPLPPSRRGERHARARDAGRPSRPSSPRRAPTWTSPTDTVAYDRRRVRADAEELAEVPRRARRRDPSVARRIGAAAARAHMEHLRETDATARGYAEAIEATAALVHDPVARRWPGGRGRSSSIGVGPASSSREG